MFCSLFLRDGKWGGALSGHSWWFFRLGLSPWGQMVAWLVSQDWWTTGWFPGDTCEGRNGISHFSLLEGQCLPPIVRSESSLQSQPVSSPWRKAENKFCSPYGVLKSKGQVPFSCRAKNDDFLKSKWFPLPLWLQYICVCSAIPSQNLGCSSRSQVDNISTQIAFFKFERKNWRWEKM